MARGVWPHVRSSMVFFESHSRAALAIRVNLTGTRLVCGTAARVVVVLLVSACGAKGGSSKVRDVLPNGIVVVKDARNVESGRPKWSPSHLLVKYLVRAPYPATGVLADIRARLQAGGWKPMAMDWVDPRRPSSHKVGWRSHGVPNKQVFNWTGQWSNPAGDVVQYRLYCESSPARSDPERSKPDNDDLRVDALLRPNRLVPPEALPPSLIVLDGARNVSAWRDRSRFRALEYEIGVRYIVTATYPPSAVMSKLTERLSTQGWVSAREEFAPPTRSPGWNFQSQTRRLATEQLFAWEADWRNQAGDRLEYELSYYSGLPPPGTEVSKPDNNSLHIRATFLSQTGEIGSGRREPARPTNGH